jgi:hypothetical protein
VLQKFHGNDATRAFQAADHSKAAHELLAQFAVPAQPTAVANNTVLDTTAQQTIQMLDTLSPTNRKCPVSLKSLEHKRPRWIQKLFTKEVSTRE